MNLLSVVQASFWLESDLLHDFSILCHLFLDFSPKSPNYKEILLNGPFLPNLYIYGNLSYISLEVGNHVVSRKGCGEGKGLALFKERRYCGEGHFHLFLIQPRSAPMSKWQLVLLGNMATLWTNEIQPWAMRVDGLLPRPRVKCRKWQAGLRPCADAVCS